MIIFLAVGDLNRFIYALLSIKRPAYALPFFLNHSGSGPDVSQYDTTFIHWVTRTRDILTRTRVSKRLFLV